MRIDNKLTSIDTANTGKALASNRANASWVYALKETERVEVLVINMQIEKERLRERERL